MKPRSKAEIERLMRAATGEIKADLIVRRAKLVNVYSGEIVPETAVAVLDGRIAYVGPKADHTLGEATRVIDANGLHLAPGFIDGHTHIGHFCRPYEYLQAYLPHGTTAVVASCDELASTHGFRGIQLFLDDVAAHPLRVFTLISMCAPQDPLLCTGRSLSQAEVAAGLADDRILGLGEIVSWLRLLQGDDELLERVETALRHRKIIHGHTAGARDQKLCAIAVAGVSSCHEPIAADDAVERLRLGYWLMLREGSLRQDLAATLQPIVQRKLSTHRLILVTDSMDPRDTALDGHMDFVVRRAIALRLPPIQAIQAATLNPATYSGLEQEIGGIAPGRWADFVLIDDLERVRVRSTFIAGEEVASDGKSLVKSSPVIFPADLARSLKLRPSIAPEDFHIPSPPDPVRIRAMELQSLTITAERLMTLQPREGRIEADAAGDLMKVAVFDRHEGSGRIALGFLKGFGARVGAVGTTVNLDENTLLVAGSRDEDMALCANAIIEAGGGIAVVDRGEILDKMDLPVAGLFSLEPWGETGEALERLHRLLRSRGSPFPRPIYALSFLTFVTLPALRITDRGLVRVKERRFVPLRADD
jgi:adenine deaminase